MTDPSTSPDPPRWRVRCECGYDRRQTGLEDRCPECGRSPHQLPAEAELVLEGRSAVDPVRRMRRKGIVAIPVVLVVAVFAVGCMAGSIGPIVAITTTVLLVFAMSVFLAFHVLDPAVTWVIDAEGIASYRSGRREAHVCFVDVDRFTYRADTPSSGDLTLVLETHTRATWTLTMRESLDASRAVLLKRLRATLVQRGVDVRDGS